jgi:hypothetical protein
MNKSYVILFILITFLSCDKEDNPIFRVVFNPVTISVSPTMSAFEEHSFLARVQTNYKNTFDANGSNPDSINYVRPMNARLNTIFEGDLDFIRAMSIRICPVGSSNTSNCGMEAFWRDPVPNNVNSEINLVNSNINDIKDLVLNDEVEIQIILERLWSAPDRVFDIQVRVEFGVW